MHRSVGFGLCSLLVLGVLAAGCGSDDSGSSPVPAPVVEDAICDTNADLLVRAIDELPDSIDRATMNEVADINSGNSQNMFANDCDVEYIERVDAALCAYLSATPAANAADQGLIDATAGIYCVPSDVTGPSSESVTSTEPAEARPVTPPPTMSAEQVANICSVSEQDFLFVVEGAGGVIGDDDLADLENIGFVSVDICGGPSEEFCDDLAKLLPLVVENADGVAAASACG